ncbi:TetR/AcrR family transcriptional regulator [Brachybacterium paraconglomeratum]|uniref:TetR/AcrR family transcriptional regulator n=1 Tax=Brachybacterium paraconglomeratum TaxID=173362 RepID=UPI0031EA6EF9
MTPAPRPPGPRAQARQRTMERIVELGNAQLVEQGVAGLSVREIARGLGMVSSAIYRYVASRDELLTLLIVDAYGDLADAVGAAVDNAAVDNAAVGNAAVGSAVIDDSATAAGLTAGASSDGGSRARFLALGDAMCSWAIAHPERWTLLYGTPVRDYSAPADATNADGTRVMQAVLRIAADAAATSTTAATATATTAAATTGTTAATAAAAMGLEAQAGIGPMAGELDLAPEVAALLESHLAEFGVETTPATGFAALTVWSSLVGMVSAHVFRQLGADAAAVGDRILAAQIRVLADLIAPL